MYPSAYIDYLVHFHGDRDYFECHEILEEYWKEDVPGERKKYWVGFIQIAVSLYHHRRSNFTGALRMMRNALYIIEEEKEAVLKLGIDYNALLKLLRERIGLLEKQEPYSSVNLPIVDNQLLLRCQESCEDKGLRWQSESDFSNDFLINKHTRRDRTDVIEERNRQKLMRNRKH